jgi:hypothetical protein
MSNELVEHCNGGTRRYQDVLKKKIQRRGSRGKKGEIRDVSCGEPTKPEPPLHVFTCFKL